MSYAIAVLISLALAACGGPLPLDEDPTVSAAVQRQRCNDGNHISGDGCSSDGYVEDGYVCTWVRRRSVCRLLP